MTLRISPGSELVVPVTGIRTIVDESVPTPSDTTPVRSWFVQERRTGKVVASNTTPQSWIVAVDDIGDVTNYTDHDPMETLLHITPPADWAGEYTVFAQVLYWPFSSSAGRDVQALRDFWLAGTYDPSDIGHGYPGIAIDVPYTWDVVFTPSSTTVSEADGLLTWSLTPSTPHVALDGTTILQDADEIGYYPVTYVNYLVNGILSKGVAFGIWRQSDGHFVGIYGDINPYFDVDPLLNGFNDTASPYLQYVYNVPHADASTWTRSRRSGLPAGTYIAMPLKDNSYFTYLKTFNPGFTYYDTCQQLPTTGEPRILVIPPPASPTGGGPPGSPEPGHYTVNLDTRLAVPCMDYDEVTGRISIAVGLTTWRQPYYVYQTAVDGPWNLQRGGVTDVTPYPIWFSVAQGPDRDGSQMFYSGVDVGAVAGPSPCAVFPDGLQCFPQVGLIRVPVLSYKLGVYPYLGQCYGHYYRSSLDGGATWFDDGPAAAGNARSDVSHGQTYLAGSRRGERSGPLDPDEIVLTSGPIQYGDSAYGATGWIYTHGSMIYLPRLPIYAHRGAPGPWSSRTGPYGDNPSGASGRTVVSYDAGRHASYLPVPTVGGLDTDLTNIPGYPFAGEWSGWGPDSMWLFGLPYQTGLTWSGQMPTTPTGGMTWAKGADTANVVYVFAAAIMRYPIPLDTLSPDGSTLAGLFHEYGEPETASSGADWGHTTPIVFTWTGDGGSSWGDLGVVMVDGEPLLVPSETVRIAAVRTASGRLVLAVGSEGIVTVYLSDDAGATWTANCVTRDGGQNWESA